MSKVGRPKLADNATKKQSIIFVAVIVLLTLVIAYCGFEILTFDYQVKKSVGKIYNDHVDSCVIENNEIDCGPNVKYLKYTEDGKEYKELSNEEGSIKVKLNKTGKAYYKTKSSLLKIVK